MIKAKPSKKNPPPSPPKDYLNSRSSKVNLRATSAPLKELIALVTDQYCAAQKRKLKQRNGQLYKYHFEVIILDLLTASISHPKLWIGYSRGKRAFLDGGRYSNPYSNALSISQQPYLNAINYLESIGWVENWTAPAGRSKVSSRCRASNELIEYFKVYELNWTSVVEDSETPCILVKDVDKNIVPYPKQADFPLEQALKNIKQINSNLSQTYLNLDISDDIFITLQNRLITKSHAGSFEEDKREPIDFTNRSLKRIFSNNTFNDGGRFYGGWWQHVPSELRKYIEIDGLITVEMDYSTMTPRILYARVGKEPPNDSYNLEGWDDQLRPIIKKAFNQLLNSDKTSRNSNQWHRFAPDMELNNSPVDTSEHEINKLLNKQFEKAYGRSYQELLLDLLTKHKLIDEFFFSSTWAEMQNLDSSIAEDVLLLLLDNETPITALPIHDSFIVRRGAEGALLEAMSTAFYKHIEVPAKIDRDETVYDPKDGKKHYPLFFGRELAKRTKKHMKESSRYIKRESEWYQVHGLDTFD